MPLDQALKDLMITSGSFQNVSSRNVYAKRTGGASVPFKCHLTLNREDRYSQEDSGTAVFSGNIIMDDVYAINKGAIISIEGQSVKATRVTTYYDEFGSHHTSVEFSGG
jgi:hypothetical protein